MKVDEFGFGFPPRALGLVKEDGKWRLVWGKKNCEESTIYSINWIPLGGFVKIHGESGDFKFDPCSFAAKPIWQRFVVLIAGVFMNFVFAAALLSIGFAVGLPSIVDDSISSSARLTQTKIQIMSVVSGSPADRAGLASGDEILSLDDKIFTSAEEARGYIKSRDGEPVKFLFQRGDDATTVSVAAEELPTYGEKAIGVGLVKTALVSYPLHLAVVKGITSTFSFTIEVFKAFGNLFWNLVVHHAVSVDLTGPVGIAVMTGEAAALGLVYLLQFAAVLSVNLAVVNILPFPALDGGRLIFLFLEKLRGRALEEKFEALAHNFGFVLLIALIVLVTFWDIFKFVG
jgi:regulator of sigma E protease